MEKNIILLGALVISCSLFSQVGINTNSPNATFDVQVKDPTNSTSLDGVIAPRLLGSQLSAKSYTSAQLGAIVYVTDASATLMGQTINVNGAGYYYFDGTVWKRMLTTMANDTWLLADTASSSSINSAQILTLVEADNGPYEVVNNTTLTVTVPTGFSQNKVIIRWDVWGSSSNVTPLPSQGSLRYAIKQQLNNNAPTQINSIMMSGWVNAYDTGYGPRWNAPVVYTINNLAAGTYHFTLMVHRENEINVAGVGFWGAQGKADVYLK